MKKTVSLVLICALSFCLLLTGCDDLPGQGGKNDFSVDLNQGKYEEGGEYGFLKDVLHTYWFNYAIDEAYTCRSYGDYTAPEGSLLLVLHIGIKNTTSKSLPMYDTDFQLWWNDDADDAYAWPLTTNEDADTDQVRIDKLLSDNMLPSNYELPINGTKVGDMIFQVPAKDVDGKDNKDFTLAFLEFFDTDEEGDFYAIDFTAEQR